MVTFPSNSYAQWRAQNGLEASFQEKNDPGAPTERLLQLVWHYQRLLRDQLRTVDDRAVRVLHPGFWNQEAGPDFHGAVLQIGTDPVRTGDVEIDLSSQGWRHHHHDQNPAYRQVILHVIWADDSNPRCPLPTLALQPYLDAPWCELKAGLNRDSLRRFSGPLLGQCGAPLRDMSVPVAEEILRQAAAVRLQAKAEHCEARARQAGWEQALWEGLFGALGYKHNVWPMRRVAELLPVLRRPADPAPSALVQQARLLGISGLLPTELAGSAAGAADYLRRIWDIWWRDREPIQELILPRLLWRFNGLRPANHPQRRLSLAAHWLAAGDWVARLENWFAASVPDSALAGSLMEVLQIHHDDYWSWHWTFRSHRMNAPQPLLGFQRATDLAVNVILPWFWARAMAGKNEAAREIAEHRYFAWPKAEDNAVLRLARQRLFGGRKIRFLTTAAAQQGLLQIVRDFCDHSNALCEHCQFPTLVRQWV